MYIETKLVRGFTEITQLYSSIQMFNGIICGGYARYCASLRKKPTLATDVDIFFKNIESFETAKNYFLSEGLEKRHENDVSYTFKIPEEPEHKWRTTPTIQLIKPMKEGKLLTFGTLEDILDHFDFTISKAAIINPIKVLVDEHFKDDELNTVLRLQNIHCPISSMFRAIKYIKRGYFLSPVESIKLFIDWEERTPEYRAKVISYLERIDTFKETGQQTLSKEELDEFEKLMRID